jgi:hypothetical protein
MTSAVSRFPARGTRGKSGDPGCPRQGEVDLIGSSTNAVEAVCNDVVAAALRSTTTAGCL